MPRLVIVLVVVLLAVFGQVFAPRLALAESYQKLPLRDGPACPGNVPPPGYLSIECMLPELAYVLKPEEWKRLNDAVMLAVIQTQYCQNLVLKHELPEQEEAWCFQFGMAKIFNAGASRGTQPSRKEGRP